MEKDKTLESIITQRGILATIKENLARSEQREKEGEHASPAKPNPEQARLFTEEETERERLAMIPYPIITTLSKLDNIYETRLFGWVLAKAQSVLKLYNKDLSYINIQHAMDLTRVTIPARLLLGNGDKNYREVVKAFTLATKKIEYERENREYHLNIIAFPELVKQGRKSVITFVIHNELWHALLDFSKGYRTFSIATFMALKSKFSVILYLLITNQREPKTYLIHTLRELTGTDGQKGYDKTGNFLMRVIDVAQKELSEKAPWKFEYSCRMEGKAHKITEIVIMPTANPNYIKGAEGEAARTAAIMRIGLDDKVRDYLRENFGMNASECERCEPLLMRRGDSQRQLEELARIKQYVSTRRVRNRAGYVYASLKKE